MGIVAAQVYEEKISHPEATGGHGAASAYAGQTAPPRPLPPFPAAEPAAASVMSAALPTR